MSHQDLFAFEDDFVQSLRCIPMAVRLKLDLTGVKLSLRQWSRFTGLDRRALLERPCASADEIAAYRRDLVALVRLRAGEAARFLAERPEPLWENCAAVPAAIGAFARSRGVSGPSEADWRRLRPLQRFALLKLSRDNHDNVNFLPAMREFGCLAAEPLSRAG